MVYYAHLTGGQLAVLVVVIIVLAILCAVLDDH